MPYRRRNYHQSKSFSTIITLIDIGMVLCPVIGYITQAHKFKTKGSSKGFSLYVTLLILTSNILRIFFWFGKHFTKVLLYQSLIVILSQIYLIKRYLDYSDNHTTSSSNNNNQKGTEGYQKYLSPQYYNEIIEDISKPSLLWKWNTLSHYILCIIGIFVLCGFEFLIFGIKNNKHTEFIGILSASIEVILGVPQIIKNFQIKDVEVISSVMLMTWIYGDCFKTIYYLVGNCPYQFIVCGFVQMIFDMVLIGQSWYYGKEDFIMDFEDELNKLTSFGNESAIERRNKYNNQDDESNKLVNARGNCYGTLDDNMDVTDI